MQEPLGLGWFMDLGLGFCVWCSVFRILGLGFKFFWGLGFWVLSLGFGDSAGRAWRLDFRVRVRCLGV